ncbi:nicotinate (nicotinamide) nucleotide adenylyltransferase [Pelagibacteraceae bacterium]|nr:nicotinate (nicotinamide) nucleotide adenylyltransferase [Pelagibacteraceae bacterium]MDC0412710.1 nicotinate (nicotinamide) nucleotide adenylyltransferase [Pelagibacteraceae bacterium]
MKLRIQNNLGILGGTFDPPHKGHLHISKLVIKKLDLKLLYWAITKQNPLKKTSPHNNENKRKTLCRQLTRSEKKIKLFNTSDVKNSNLTINILREIKKKITKKTNLFFIIGADNLVQLHQWKDYKKIFSLCTVVVMNRIGYKKPSLTSPAAKKFRKTKISLDTLLKIGPKQKEWVYINNKGINVSSSRLRISLYK